MKWTIFFDLDGTLIDTSERHYKVYKDILTYYKIPNTLTKKEFWNKKRKGGKTVEFLPKNSSKELIQRFTEEWLKRIEDRRYLKYDSLLRESLGVLSVLKNKACLMLVTLRNNRENLLWELDNFGLTNYFKEILANSSLEVENKIPLIKDYIERNSKRDNFIIVGDTEADISAGKEIGMLSVAVTYGIRSKEFIAKLKPDFCIDNLPELPEILNETFHGDK